MLNNHNGWGGAPTTGGLSTTLFDTEKKVRVKRLIVRDVGAFHQQFYRPFEATPQRNVVDFINNASNGGSHTLDATALSAVAGDFMNPSFAPIGAVGIENGWDTPRFRFMMEVEVSNSFVTSTELIQGYTDFQGISQQTRAFAPDMMFTINSISRIRYSVSAYGTNAVNVIDSSHVLAENMNSYVDGSYGVPQYNMTPNAMLQNLSLRQYDTSARIVDTALGVREPKLSSRKNSNAACYLSKVVGEYQNATRSPDYDAGGDSYRGTLASTVNRTHETSITDCNFMMVLTGKIGGYANKFTFRDLVSMDPMVESDQVTMVLYTPPNAMIDATQSSEVLSGSDYSTRFALVINAALPTIMMDNLLTKITFSSTNRVSSGQPFTMVTKADSFVSIDLSQQMTNVIDRINREIMNVISQKGIIDYEVTVNSDLTGTTVIGVSLDGNHVPITYTFPTFTDALYTPILSTNLAHIDGMVNGLNAVYAHMNQPINGFGVENIGVGMPINPSSMGMQATPMMNLTDAGGNSLYAQMDPNQYAMMQQQAMQSIQTVDPMAYSV